MVWTEITIGECTGLHIIRKTTSRVRSYTDESLRPKVVFYVKAINYFFFQTNYAKSHRARFIENIHETETMHYIE